jgi:hypothetical protein
MRCVSESKIDIETVKESTPFDISQGLLLYSRRHAHACVIVAWLRSLQLLTTEVDGTLNSEIRSSTNQLLRSVSLIEKSNCQFHAAVSHVRSAALASDSIKASMHDISSSTRFLS